MWIRKHNHAVVVSLLAMGLELDRSENIANAAWERLIRKHENGVLSQISMPGLAIAQARFLALDYVRRERPKRLAEAELQGCELATHRADANPERVLLAQEQLQRASECLNGCSEKSRRVFRLFYVDELSAAEIGARLDISAQRVRQTLCEVRRVIRTAWEES